MFSETNDIFSFVSFFFLIFIYLVFTVYYIYLLEIKMFSLNIIIKYLILFFKQF